MKKITLTILGILLAAGMLSADHEKGHKGKGPMMHGKMFEKMDTDKDGKISKQEWQAHHETMFSKMDADQDGFLTKDEMKAHHKQMMQEHGMKGAGEEGEHGKGKKKKKKPAKEEDEDKPE